MIALSRRISHEGKCAQARDIAQLDTRARALVHRRRVPAALAESFMSGVNALVAQTPICLPPVTVTAPTPARPAPTEHGHHGKHGHGKHGDEGD